MRATEALEAIQSFGRPVIETGEVVARLDVTSAHAGALLRRLESAGHIQRLRQGVWLVDKGANAFTVVPYLTRPFPSYVSLWSALARYGMIEQIPAKIFVVSLDRPKSIETPLGVYEIHHVVPEVFGGYNGSDLTGFIASQEKALFDTVYLLAAQRRSIHLPEIELPEDFNAASLDEWVARIHAPWLKGRVRRALDQTTRASVLV